MTAYPYSVNTVKQILEEMNVTGKLKRSWLQLDSDGYTRDFIEVKQEYNQERKNYHKAEREDPEELSVIEEELKHKKLAIEDVTEDIINNIYKHINAREIRINIKKPEENVEKPVFEAKNRDSYFLCKIITKELEKVYKVETFPRDNIMSDLATVLEDPCDKIIIRTDVKHFFESIPRQQLLQKIGSDGIVCNKTLKLLRRLDYDLSDNKFPIGIPRGLSFASVLSEIYLRDIDRRINQIKGLYFYRRFVDDIIIIANYNAAGNNLEELISEINKFFKDKELELHNESDKDNKFYCKTLKYGQDDTANFDYLGYHIEIDGNEHVKFSLSKDRFERYKKYIDIIFKFYSHHAFIKPKGKIEGESSSRVRHSQPLYKLYMALNFLTRNYSLSGKKGSIKSGVYFKHRQITETSQWGNLDKYLYSDVDKYINSNEIVCKSSIPNGFCEKIAKKIKDNYSFELGFNKRLMCRLSSNDIKSVKRILKYNE